MKISKSSQILMVATMVLGIQCNGQCQGNLVNFYDWTSEGYPAGNAPPVVSSANSATFAGGYNLTASGNPLITGILTGNLTTTPGTTYDISYTLTPYGGHWAFGADVTFGSDTEDLTRSITPYDSPLSFDYSIVAVSSATTMSFDFTPDNADFYVLSDVSVTEVPALPVPETSTMTLLAFGGCVLLMTRRWPRGFKKEV